MTDAEMANLSMALLAIAREVAPGTVSVQIAKRGSPAPYIDTYRLTIDRGWHNGPITRDVLSWSGAPITMDDWREMVERTALS